MFTVAPERHGGTPNRLPWVLAVQKTVVHQAFPVLEPLTPVTGFRGPGPVDFPCCPSEWGLRTLQWGDDSRPRAFRPQALPGCAADRGAERALGRFQVGSGSPQAQWPGRAPLPGSAPLWEPQHVPARLRDGLSTTGCLGAS